MLGFEPTVLGTGPRRHDRYDPTRRYRENKTIR